MGVSVGAGIGLGVAVGGDGVEVIEGFSSGFTATVFVF